MRTQRDHFQRKASAIRRMALAMERQVQATSVTDLELATRWVSLWSAVAGIRLFKLNKPGKAVHKKYSPLSPRRKLPIAC